MVSQTPIFMPCGTYGSVKMLLRAVERSGFEIPLGNTFHLMLRPGPEVIEKFEGCIAYGMGETHPYRFWFSGVQSQRYQRIDEKGVVFVPCKRRPDPAHAELSMEMQMTLNSDIAMCFDECTPIRFRNQSPSNRWNLVCAGRGDQGARLNRPTHYWNYPGRRFWRSSPGIA